MLRKPWFQGLVAAGIITILVLAINLLQDPGDSGTSMQTPTGSGAGAPSGVIQTPPEGVNGNGASPPAEIQDPYPPDITLFSWEREEPTSFYPRGCPLTSGQECVVRFIGTYRLETLDSAILRFGAYENGSSDPVAFYDEEVVRGSDRMIYHLVFVVSESARNVQFKVTLHRPDGSMLYEPDPAPPVLEVRSAE